LGIGTIFCQNKDICTDLYLQVAKKMAWNGEKEESAKYYRKALTNRALFSKKDYLKATSVFLKVDAPSDAYLCLKNAARKGLTFKEISKDSTIYSIFRKHPEINLGASLEKSKIHHQGTNIITTMINDLFEIDQWIRTQGNLPTDKDGLIFQAIDSGFIFNHLTIILDSINVIDKLYLNEDTQEQLSLLLRHQTGRPMLYEQIVPNLKMLLNRKLISGYEYAKNIDSYLLYKKGKQRYVTHYIYDEVTDTDLMKPIENIKTVNEQRLLIGILPIFSEIDESLTEVDFGEERGIQKGHKFKRLKITEEKKLLNKYFNSNCSK
jgi:hypothetical protein